MLRSLSIVEEFLGNNIPRMVAKTILKSQDIYEDSWNQQEHRYDLSHEDAADEACEATGLNPTWSKYISHWNWNIWNDVQGWAEAMLEEG